MKYGLISLLPLQIVRLLKLVQASKPCAWKAIRRSHGYCWSAVGGSTGSYATNR